MATSRIPERVVALATAAGGLLIAAGAWLPWLSFYAGLYPMRGVMGPWGRVLAAGGGLCAVAGIVQWRRFHASLVAWVAVFGCVLTAFAGWLVVQLLLTFRELHANPMVVPRLGPGLFMALAGALVTAAPALWQLATRRSSRAPATLRR